MFAVILGKQCKKTPSVVTHVGHLPRAAVAKCPKPGEWTVELVGSGSKGGSEAWQANQADPFQTGWGKEVWPKQ